MSIGMGVMVLALTGAGVVQVWLQRLPEGNAAQGFMAVQDQLRPFYWVRVGGGAAFLAGLLTYFASFFIGGPAPGPRSEADEGAEAGAVQPAAA